jgi:hypothetical protein
MRAIASLLAAGLLSCVSTLALAQGPSAVFTSFDFPGSNATSPGAITPDGKIVGDYVGPDGNQHGFLLSDGTFQTIDFPGSTRTTVWWINARGQISSFHPETAAVPWQREQFRASSLVMSRPNASSRLTEV